MGKGLIIYQSKYGAAKKYAMWLAEATGFDVVETPKADSRALKEYDRIILCGSIYASGIAGISFLRRTDRRLKGRRQRSSVWELPPMMRKRLKK